MTPTSQRVGGMAGHMATTLDNGENSDLAPYLPPVLSQPVVQIVQRMVPGEEEPSCSYADAGELDAPTGGHAAALPPQGATASSEDSSRPPRGRMDLLHQHLGTENDLRMALIRQEHDLLINLLQEDHDATLALKTENYSLKYSC
ncbi:uncharacterized protein LOC144154801 [Haemaphysalis longicornis]